jgi:hypothetical protein
MVLTHCCKMDRENTYYPFIRLGLTTVSAKKLRQEQNF